MITSLYIETHAFLYSLNLLLNWHTFKPYGKANVEYLQKSIFIPIIPYP